MPPAACLPTSFTPLRRTALSTLAAVAMVVAIPAASGAQLLSGLLDQPLQTTLKNVVGGSTRVIVRTEPGALDGVLRLLQALGGQVYAPHRFINAVTVTVPAVSLNLVVGLPGVLSISLDAPVQGGSTDDRGGTGSHLAATLGLETGRGAVDGTGIGVAIIDSGIAPTGTYRLGRFVDFTKPSRGRTYTDNAEPRDEYGHGTHVAGLIGGNGRGSDGRYRGVAPGATLVGLKVLDRNGAGYTSDVLVALEYAVTNRQALGLRVLNLSLGHPIFEPADRDPLVQAVEKAVREGLVVVVSAGNLGCLPGTTRCGYAGITSPGNAPSAITVGAIDTRQTTSRVDDDVPAYSSRGPSWYDGYAKPDLVAPGHRLVSTIAPSSTLGRDETRTVQAVSASLAYSRLSGTSMATAVASGAVALVLHANESRYGARSGARLSPNAVKAVLEFTSFTVSGADELTQGAGALNAAGAIYLAQRVEPATPAGGSWLTASVTPSTRIGDDALPWTQRIIWGDRVAFGESVYANERAWAQAIVWGDTLVWGDALVWGNAIVWGDALVWGNTLIWADSLVWGDSMYDAEGRTWGNLAHAAPSGSSLPDDR